AESTLAGFFGGLGGIALGVALSFIVVGAFGGNLGIGGGGGRGFGGRSAASSVSLQITPMITAELLIGTLLLAVVIGTLAGLLPAWRAAKMIPVEALKYE
ncbi:MAG: ABC transporter permease, partial [Thaumarchaeota archaeon]|nr:ABC transporter permease [Nitrososphaerota archaeon]